MVAQLSPGIAITRVLSRSRTCSLSLFFSAMSSSPDASLSLDALLDKLQQGQDLLQLLSSPDLAQLPGVAKIQKKIRQEVKFLSKFRSSGGDGDGDGVSPALKKEHLACSNLLNLNAIVQVLSTTPNVTACLSTFSYATADDDLAPWAPEGMPEDPEVDAFSPVTVKKRKLTVDLVCSAAGGGVEWVKVVARNPKALDLNSAGGNQFGQKSFMEQVAAFLTCAKQNPVMFQVPKVVYVFFHGVSDVLARKLERRGVIVRGEIIPSVAGSFEDDDSDEDSDNNSVASDDAGPGPCDNTTPSHLPAQRDDDVLNLDITAMIAYVSALTNGHAHHVFDEPILNNQAAWERERPVRPFLDSVFSGKKLICCRSAMADFQSILATLGGPGERERAKKLADRLEVVDDLASDRLAGLDVASRRMKERSKAIFGTGDARKVVTVSANSGFVRAAKGKGVELAVILHESRALTEDKMARVDD